MASEKEELWLAVIGRGLALLAMHRAELGNSDLVIRAEFLERLGIPRADVAEMLGSSADSLAVMFSRRKRKGGKRRGKKKGGRND